MESDYQADLMTEKWRVFWQTNLLCAGLYACFSILDIWAMPAELHQAWAVRGAVISVTLGVTGACARRRQWFAHHYVGLVTGFYLLWALGILTLIALSTRGELAWGSYYAGLILVSMALYAWTYLTWKRGLVIGILIFVSYLACAIIYQRMAEDAESRATLLLNGFFLVSANILGLFCLHTREQFARQSFLLKNRLRRELEAEEAARREHAYRADHDSLTGLFNRAGFVGQLQKMLDDAGSQTVAVLFMDLNGFKPVNDAYGHAAGDHVLQRTAERLRHTIRSSDLAGRVGGDEFVVALSYMSPQEHWLQRLSLQLQEAIREPIDWNGHALAVSASIGAATSREVGGTAPDLIEAADLRMYTMKHGDQARTARASESVTVRGGEER
jgi:diguanylate cyclase (GGDEF)-like protein